MNAYLNNMHLLVPMSRSSAKVKVKYKGYISQEMAVSGAFVFHKHILLPKALRTTHAKMLPLVCFNQKAVFGRDFISMKYTFEKKYFAQGLFDLKHRKPNKFHQPFK